MNNISQKKYHSFFKTVILLFISLILALVFCESTSPLYIVYGNDGIEYKLAGSAILDGCVMFKDIFHQKGVLFFYVESIGEFLCRLLNNDRLGTWIIQVINIFICLLIAENINKQFVDFTYRKDHKLNGIKAYFPLFTFMFMWMSLIGYSNQVEEFAMLYQLIAFNIVIKYIIELSESKNEAQLKPYNGFILGLCFAVSFFFKPTSCVIIGTIVLFGLFLFIKFKKYKSLILNAITSLLGVLAVSIPIVVITKVNGSFVDMIEQCFLFNIAYLDLKNFSKHSIAMFLIVLAFLVLSVILICINNKNLFSWLLLFINVTNAISMTVQRFSFYFYLMPIAIIAFLSVIAVYSTDLELIKNKNLKNLFVHQIPALLLVFVTAFYMTFQFSYQMYEYAKVDKTKWSTTVNNVRKFIDGTSDIIDDGNLKDMYIIENSDNLESRYMYYKLQRYPFSNAFCRRFLVNYESTSSVSKKLNDKFYEDYKKSPPKYIVDYSNPDSNDVSRSINKFILNEINSGKYKMVYQDNHYILYQLNN